MAFLRAAFSSLSDAGLVPRSCDAGSSWTLQSGQQFEKPGFPGFNSNSSPQTLQVLMGNAMKQ
jgi:hypothetical protein